MSERQVDRNEVVSSRYIQHAEVWGSGGTVAGSGSGRSGGLVRACTASSAQLAGWVGLAGVARAVLMLCSPYLRTWAWAPLHCYTQTGHQALA